MPDVCERLDSRPEATPDPTTFYYSFERYVMYIWRALLRGSPQQLHHSGHAALDSTSFERRQASQYYRQWNVRNVGTSRTD
jgi:hypothetical protein